MHDNFFEDDENDEDDMVLPPAHAQGGESVCKVTVLSISKVEQENRLAGFAQRILTETDIVLTNSFNGRLIEFAKANRAPKTVSLSTYRRLGSDEEISLFDHTTEEIAKLALALDDVRVAQVDIGSCWALGLRAEIFRELYSVYTINRILEENVDRMVVLLPGFGASELALIARLMELQGDGKVDLQSICELKDGCVKPYNGRPIRELRNLITKRHNENDFSVSPATKERMVGLPKAVAGERPTQADVLFMHFTDNLMFQRNIAPVIDAVKARKGVPAVLICNGNEVEVYDERLTSDKIYRFNPKVAWGDDDMLNRLAQQIATRTDVAARDISPLKTWTPLFAAYDNAGMFASLKKMLTFQSAMNLMQGWVKPRSIYVTQSPDTNPYAYLAMSTSRAQCNFYYSFSSLIHEDTRSLPFVAPAELLAYGEQDKSIIGARNDKAGRIANIVGTPSYDVIQSLDIAKAKQGLRKELDLPNEGKAIVLMPSRQHPEVEDVWLARFLRWANEEGLICILVKGRRAGTKDFTALEAIADAKQWSKTRFIYRDRINAIAAADIVITDQVEASVEAVLMDKMMVHVRLGDVRENIGNLFDGIGFEVDSENDLQDIVSSILMDEDFLPEDMQEKRQKFKKWVNGNNDGTSSAHVASFLLRKGLQAHSFESPFAERCVLKKPSKTPKNIIRPANFLL